MKLKKDRFAWGDKLSAPFGGGTMMRRLTVVSVAVALSVAVPAGTLTWTGGSATSDNFSDSANWSPAQAPASGDTLVFRGETRTSPVNDLDPELFTFKELILSNDNSSGCSASFTFSGNRLKLTSSITLVKAVSGSLTDVFGLDVEFSGSGNKKIGGGSLNNHHITFNGGVSGPSNVDLETPSQYAGTIYFNGPISGFSGFYRPNGGANIYFRGLNTAFTGLEGYKINQGNMYFIDADNFGPAPKFRSGQGGWSTAGGYYFDPTNDVTITATIAVNAPSQVNNGLTLANRTAGTTLTFTGDVVEGGTANNVGTRLAVDGSGTGVLKGNFTKDRMAFLKQGSGTWILSDEIETCSMTGLVTVSAGKLVVDCTLQPNQCMTVSANATIAGKGTLGAPVTFKSGARYEVSVDGNGTYNTLTIPGTVTLEGNVTVNRMGGGTLAPGSRTALLAFDAKGGPGSFVIGSGFPGDAVLQVDGNVLYVERRGERDVEHHRRQLERQRVNLLRRHGRDVPGSGRCREARRFNPRGREAAERHGRRRRRPPVCFLGRRLDRERHGDRIHGNGDEHAVGAGEERVGRKRVGRAPRPGRRRGERRHHGWRGGVAHADGELRDQRNVCRVGA